MNALAEFPNETVVNSSPSVIVGGFVLTLAAIVVAVSLSQAAHVEDLFSRHKVTWGSSFSVVESIALFLVCWLVLSGVFMVFAGSIEEIEVFREDEQMRAAILVLVAAALLAAFVGLSKIGRVSTEELEELKQGAKHVDRKWVEGTSTYYWIGVFLLFWSVCCTVVAASGLSAWTLPSKQQGTQLFLAPGLSLTAGAFVLLFLLALETGWSLDSRPDGWKQRPLAKDADYAYLDSTTPVVGGLFVCIIGIATSDPAMPLPLTASLLFSPKSQVNLLALGLCLVSSLFAVYLLVR